MRINMTIVGGGGSTGTHLLASILHDIGDIRVGPEIHVTHHRAFYNPTSFRRALFRSLTGTNTRIAVTTKSGAKYEILPARVLDNKAAYGIDAANLFDVFENSHCFADFVKQIKTLAAEKNGWPADFHWFEHSPRNSICAVEFLNAFPEDKFIHLIRDGRDAMASQAARFQKTAFPGLPLEESLDISVELWCLLQNGAILAEGKPGYLRIRYEDLTARPVETVNLVLEHLGYPRLTEEQFLRHRESCYPELGFTKQEGWKNDLRSTISSSSIGRWKTDLSEDNLSFLRKKECRFGIYPRTMSFAELQQYFGYE